MLIEVNGMLYRFVNAGAFSMRSLPQFPSLSLFACGLLASPLAGASDAATTLDAVVVTGAKSVTAQSPATASRLGLTLRETPAVLDVLDQTAMLARGVRTSIEAFNATPGVVSANLASAPGSLSMRGFTGGAIALLFDGVRQTAGPIVTREFDAWGFERIEVLKGPASVMFGEGALAGAVNLVPKKPHLDAAAFAGLASIGSFDAARLAIDANQPLGPHAGLRLIASGQRSDGHIDGAASDIAAATLAFAWQPNDALRVDVAVDHLEDDYTTSTWGTPLLPLAVARQPTRLLASADGRVLDRALREVNFNVGDGVQDSDTDWLRTRVEWRINDTWRLTNEASYYDGERRWLNAETYTFNATRNALDRGSSRIEHDHQFWVERVALAADTRLGGLRNRFSVGAEFSVNDFTNIRQFGTATTVDLRALVRGSFPTGAEAGTPTVFDSEVKVASVFIEDALNLSDRWLLVGGARYERIELDRQINRRSPTPQRFGREYTPLSWRLGSVFDLSPTTQLYAQASSASAPVGSMLIMSLTNSRFDLTSGEAFDAGVRRSLLDGRVDLTLAGYWIRQEDIVTRDPRNASIAVQGGTQSSRGLEASLAARVSERLRVDASVAALDARFDRLREAGNADRSGNTPPMVPELVAQVFTSYTAETLPLTFSGSVRHVGRFYTDNANAIRVSERSVFDAAVSWRLPEGVLRNSELTLRGRNLTDALYAEWSGGAADQLVLGAPRSLELEWRVAL